MHRRPGRLLRWMVAAVVAVGIASLMGIPGAVAEFDEASARLSQAGAVLGATEPMIPGPAADEIAVQLAGADPPSAPQESKRIQKEELVEEEDYDPWLPFNERMFEFNRQFDRFLLKPVATVWDKLLPDPVKRSLKNALDNLGMPVRFLNSLFQGKFDGAGRELGRFVFNSTIGIAGLFDAAKEIGVEKSEEDTGQTLGFYGVGPGPYLVLPLLPPLTVRDGIGFAVDLVLDPLNYVLPLAASTGRRSGEIVNERSFTLELYQNVEETVLDLYSAVRNAHLQRRQRMIEE